MQIKAATSAGFATVQLNRPSINPAGSGTNTGDVTLAAVGTSPTAAAASLSGQILTLQPADATHPGVLTTGTQTIAGDKTLTGSTIMGQVGAFRFTSNPLTDPPWILGVVGSGIAGKSDNIPALTTAGDRLWSFQNNSVEQSGITKDGGYTTKFTDTSGTPGAGTANTISGRSSLSSGSAFDITNSCCAAGSIVLTQIETVDATCKSVKAVATDGKFTATATAAPTGTVVFSWVVVNGK
jgi:hypothetical protein